VHHGFASLNLLHTRLGESPFTQRRLSGFLHETVQHDDPLPDLSTEKDAGDAIGALQAQFEQAATEGLGVWLTQIRPKDHHAPGQDDVPCRQGVRQRRDGVLDGHAVVEDRVAHRPDDNKYVSR
jgi:hypothetical protein